MATKESQYHPPARSSGRLWERINPRTRDSLYGYLFVAPQMIGFFLVVFLPLIAVFVFSTQQRNLLSGQVTDVGLENYTFMLNSDPFFGTVLKNSLILYQAIFPLKVKRLLTSLCIIFLVYFT